MSPVAPRTPLTPKLSEFVIFFEERLVFTVFSGVFSGVVIVSEDFLKVTSKTEYTEENKSLTITQTTFRSSTEDGRGFLESPKISEKIPSFTFK